MKKLCLYDLGVVSALKPDVIILEIGTIANRPEVVGSEIQPISHSCSRAFSQSFFLGPYGL